MARPYRIQVENSLYHVISRGNEKGEIFRSTGDYEKFLSYVGAAREKYGFYLHTYVLMSNHYHLFIELTDCNLSRIMQLLNTSYTVYFNRKYQRSGHLFQGRYKSFIVDTDNYYSELTRYIHLNPVRAGIVDDPVDYTWSSYRDYLRPRCESFADMPAVERYLTIDLKRYRQFVFEGIGKEERFLDRLYASCIVGNEPFRRETLKDLEQYVEKGDFAHKRKLMSTVSPEEIITAVATVFDERVECLLKGRSRRLPARKAGMYFLKQLSSLTNAEIGEMFGVSGSLVSKVGRDFPRLCREDRSLSKVMKMLAGKDSRFKL
jgi:putative transposase